MMNRKRMFVSAALAAGIAVLSLCVDAHAQGRVYRNIFIPDSSVEHAGDRGVRTHTDFVLLMNPAGGLGPGGGMTPAQIRSFYNMASTGGHDVIAIVDAYNFPAALTDFNTFAAQFGLPTETSTSVTSSTNKVFQVVYQGGKKPSANVGWEQEEALDIEWAHAMAPGAKIVLVEAQSNSNANLYAAVDVAAKMAGVKEVSMSWGGGESSGELSDDSHFNVNGPVFFAACGDQGGIVSYPSSSPYVVGVGGTSVATNSSGQFVSETGWSSGGGGNSAYEPKPTWQQGIANTGSRRSVPDISADADPNTGVAVYGPTSSRKSGWLVFGGTSVSTPCVAGMVNLGGGAYNNTTEVLTSLYALIGSSSFRDITVGNNGFPCLPGWDFVTGVGSPQGTGGF